MTTKQATKTIKWSKVKPDFKRIAANKDHGREVLKSAYNDGSDVYVTDSHVALQVSLKALTDVPMGAGEGYNVHTGEVKAVQYPQVQRLFEPGTVKSEVTLNKTQVNEMKKAFERMGVLVKDTKNNPVKWSVYGETSKLNAVNSEDGSTAEEVAGHGKHANFHEVHVNYKLINKAFMFAKKTMSAGDEITVKFFGELRPILIEGNEWRALVMPVRPY